MQTFVCLRFHSNLTTCLGLQTHIWHRPFALSCILICVCVVFFFFFSSQFANFTRNLEQNRFAQLFSFKRFESIHWTDSIAVSDESDRCLKKKFPFSHHFSFDFLRHYFLRNTKMGRFLGHGATGTFFYLLGLHMFLRSTDVRFLRALRTDYRWLASEGIGLSVGGLIYTVGEVSLMLVEVGYWKMSTTQHVLMSASFSLCGCILLLHLFKFLRGVAWIVVEPLLWFLLGLLWYLHPQDNGYFAFGHASIGLMFMALAFSRLGEALVMFYSNAAYHRRVALAQYRPHGRALSLSTVAADRVHSMYTNEAVYATPLPVVSAFLLMLIGTWDWDMAVHFLSFDVTKVLDASVMDAEETWFVHLLFNLSLCLALALGLQIADQRFCGSDGRHPSDFDEHHFHDLNGKRVGTDSDGDDRDVEDGLVQRDSIDGDSDGLDLDEALSI
jgi:hypothetical protein